MKRLLVPTLLVMAGCRHDHTSQAPAEPAHGHHHHHGHHADAMPHRFERADDWVARFDDPARDAWQKPDAVIASLGLQPGDTVADVGAGTGYFTVRLAKAVPSGKVYASDIEPDMVRHLGERAQKEGLTNVTAVQGGAIDPNLPGPVHVVLVVDVLHHVADRPAFFAALAADLDDDGSVVIVDFKPDAPEGTPGPPREHRLTVDQVTADARAAGLVLANTDAALLPYQYVVRLARAR